MLNPYIVPRRPYISYDYEPRQDNRRCAEMLMKPKAYESTKRSNPVKHTVLDCHVPRIKSGVSRNDLRCFQIGT